jgi:hypothetical protein
MIAYHTIKGMGYHHAFYPILIGYIGATYL